MTGTLTSTFIWFREGLEAWLIVQIAWNLIKNRQQQLTILGSIALALLASVILAFGAVEMIQRDIKYIEAGTALTASALLLWSAWFCHGAQAHTREIEENLKHQGPLLILATIVFLTVFREGVEVVAFLSAGYLAGLRIIEIGAGAVFGLGSLILVAWLANKHIARIPVRSVFKTSQWVFTVLAVYFLYYGIHELLE
jgi:FTR1 family protein